MCDDPQKAIADLNKPNVACAEPMDPPWGVLPDFKLPGGERLGLYQPTHALAHAR